MTIGKRIRQERLNRGLSQEELAKSLSTTKQAIYKYENEIVTNIPMDKIEKLAQLFNTTPAYLMGWNEEKSSPTRIPVYGKVAAGIPIDAITDIEDYEEITDEMARQGEYAALKIKGNSMLPRFADGDIVIVKLQSDVNTGDIAIVLINGDEATCKKIKKTLEGVMLISTNPEYEPLFFSNKEIEEKPVRIWGKVVELRAKF